MYEQKVFYVETLRTEQGSRWSILQCIHINMEMLASQEYDERVRGTLLWKWAQLSTSLKCLYMTAHNMGHNQEKEKSRMQFRAAISLQSWRAVVTAHTAGVLLRMDTGY